MDQGRHFLFIPGPTHVPERVLRALSRSMEDHRGASFPEFSKPLFEDLKKLFKTEDGEMFIFPSSGTGAAISPWPWPSTPKEGNGSAVSLWAWTVWFFNLMRGLYQSVDAGRDRLVRHR